MIHETAMSLLRHAVEHGWTAAYIPGEDTGGSPYVTIEAVRKYSKRIRITWHTRKTGTFRLFSCMAGDRHISLKNARKRIATEGSPGQEASE